MTFPRALSLRPPGPELDLFLRGFGVFLVLTGLQLSLPLVGRAPGEALAVFVGNLVASAPWLPLGAVVVHLTRKLATRPRSGLALHGPISGIVALVFLAWLAAFHRGLAMLEADPLAPSSYGAWLRADLQRFFAPAVAIYWLIVAGTLLARAQRSADRRAETETGNEGGVPAAAPGSSGVAPGFRRIAAPYAGGVRWIDAEAVEWMEADGSYVALHSGSRRRLVRRPLGELTTELAELGFVRIHRSRSVRVDRVAELRRRSHGDAVAVLRDGTELGVSRTFRERLVRRLPPA